MNWWRSLLRRLARWLRVWRYSSPRDSKSDEGSARDFGEPDLDSDAGDGIAGRMRNLLSESLPAIDDAAEKGAERLEEVRNVSSGWIGR